MFGNPTDELCVRPSGEHGWHSFKLENEEALFVAETVIDTEPGDEWLLEAQARGHGQVSVGLVAHDRDGNMISTVLHAAAFAELDGETTQLRALAARIAPAKRSSYIWHLVLQWAIKTFRGQSGQVNKDPRGIGNALHDLQTRLLHF